MEKFKKWLVSHKKYKPRTSNDICSRLRRSKAIVRSSSVSKKSLTELIQSSEYENLSGSVKSQLKKSITLYLEFKSS